MGTANHGLGPTRARVLALLQSAGGPMSITDIADRLDMHKNSARFHLDSLVKAGYAERRSESTGHQGRPPMMYSGTQAAPSLSNLHLIELTEVLIETFVTPQADHLERAESAGALWGGKVESPTSTDPDGVIHELAGHMGKRGFVTTHEENELVFTRCPFRNIMSKEQLPVVCRLHQGMLDSYVADTDVDAGRIAVGPKQCRVAFDTSAEAVAS
ncbi:MAG TPA: helix-turn-helix domain-containing protein [Tessaracoccus flavescens]|uniref:Helix-turn-helix domain-containing protein n=1 Tax=Tessaracoccus flavescens TaxID=399497 RepID=A0A921EMF9_9ACTN|nr:helix-turn-helix domain-containing protein [Tessaracoccus flavescens]